jgi:hypothetical protein
MREYREPLLDEMLADPIVRALMVADGVDREELTALLRAVARPRRGGSGDNEMEIAQ